MPCDAIYVGSLEIFSFGYGNNKDLSRSTENDKTCNV